eukprot:TRINITY_DN3229_c0_g1_i1.p1 TRINITY_DN3229_c0_g1~~TRINITY_DN3229_c0_g1_i1.p1  ORF type:complete len:344 (+),score=107.38 TRINITY_DN3229_c0_g1_i1:136-1167(+)
MLSDYDYHLPEELIAQTPLTDRSSSRLLWLHKDDSSISHHKFLDVIDILQPGDLLVMNNTRVTALRLMGNKETGAKVEALLLRNGSEPTDFYALTFPARKLKVGTIIHFEQGLKATVLEEVPNSQGQRLLRFHSSSEPVNVLLDRLGKTPLPPYIKAELEQRERYQTVYATQGGSAAAPTAGLHFTPDLLDCLSKKGVNIAYVTLDVSMDTFRPVHEQDLSKVVMHGEHCSIPLETIKAIETCKGRVIAVGTTSVRTLETYCIGPRKFDINNREGVSKIFIWPGGDKKFQVIDGMFTNFHMPQTTMLMMISTLAGWQPVKTAYDVAVAEKYRFLSFGDSMLIL